MNDDRGIILKPANDTATPAKELTLELLVRTSEAIKRRDVVERLRARAAAKERNR